MIPALIVVRPFAAHGLGAAITDPNEMARVLGDERAANVVRVSLPGTPAAEEKSPAAAARNAVNQPAKEG